MASNPRSRRGPAVERGGSAPIGEDEELSRGTEQRPSAPMVSRGGRDVDDDPERDHQTNQRVAVAKPLSERKKRPSIVERGGRRMANDPERNNKTGTVPVSEPSGVVSRRAQPSESSAAEWEAPPGKMSRELRPARGRQVDDEEPPADSEEAEPPDYRTGNDYEPYDGSQDEISMEGRSLEGDGLDALDPDLEMAGSKTANLPADYDGKDDDEGADDANATNAGPPLKLEIVSGPDTGKKKKFRGVRMVVGRTPGVDLQLTDQSVSRRHIELIVGDGGVMLRDLGSGNGSKVNGEKVTEKVLSHGDEIHIGKTKLRFIDEVGAFKKARDEAEKKEASEGNADAASAEGAPPPGEGEGAADAAGEEAAAKSEGAEGEEGAEGDGAQGGEAEAGGEPAAEGEAGKPGPATGARPKVLTGRNKEGTQAGGWKAMDPKKRLALIGGPVVLLLVIVAVVLTRPKPPPPPDPLKTQAAEKMQAARDAVRTERYEEAIKLIDEAEKLVPGIDQTRLATQARNELAVVTALDEVKRLFEARKFEDAKAALARAPQGSVRTEEAKKKLSDELAEAEANYKKQRFQELIAQGQIDGAEQALSELNAADRHELTPALDDAKRALEESVREEKRQRALAEVGAKERTKQQKAEAIALAFAVVARKFTGQEWARAAAECDRVIDANPGDDDIRKRAKQLQQQIPSFGRNFEEGMKKYRANQLAGAAKPLHKAYELYQQIGLQSSLGEELKEKLAQAALFSGKEALLREDLATAALYFKEAVKLDPDEPKGRELLNEVIGRADELYQSAYMIRDRDPAAALRMFKTVVEITPSGSTTHEKAKNQVAAMQP